MADDVGALTVLPPGELGRAVGRRRQGLSSPFALRVMPSCSQPRSLPGRTGPRAGGSTPSAESVSQATDRVDVDLRGSFQLGAQAADVDLDHIDATPKSRPSHSARVCARAVPYSFRTRGSDTWLESAMSVIPGAGNGLVEIKKTAEAALDLVGG
jgi:hypothetical protein